MASSLSACANGNGANDNTTSQEVTTTKVVEGTVNEIGQAQFAELIADWQANEWHFKGQRPAVIDFTATWCGPCRKLAPILKELARHYSGKIDFYSVDVDDNKSLVYAFGVRSIPMLMICPVDGQPQALVGLYPKEDIITAIKDITTVE